MAARVWLLLLATCGAVHARSRASLSLWGLAMVHNSPEEPALVRIDATTGATKGVGGGPPLSPLAATGDLACVNSRRRVLWYLGDTSALGTTLAGVSLDTGKLVCQQVRAAMSCVILFR